MTNDIVYVYAADLHKPLNHICCLQNFHQKNVSFLAWHPVRDDVLAVATSSKIIVWLISTDLKNFKVDSEKCLRILDVHCNMPFTGLAYSNDGNSLFACSPRTSSLLHVKFDPSSKDLKKYSHDWIRNVLSPPLTSLLVSPDNTRILALTTSNTLLMLENIAWSSKFWSCNLADDQYCQTSCWSKPHGRILLYTPTSSSKVYAYTFFDKAEAGDVGGGPDKSILVLDTSVPLFDEVQLGKVIHHLVWNRDSSILAVSFKGTYIFCC